jgi:hypothetical protein
MDPLTETMVFLVHAVKQFCFGFERLDDKSDEYEDGSAAKAFYLTSIYNYLAVFYLLDQGPNDALGGAIYKALKRHRLEDALAGIARILRTPIGTTNFGELVRVFRNKVVVHTSYSDADLDRLYEAADMHDSKIVSAYQSALVEVYAETKLLPLVLIPRVGLRLEDFGIHVPAATTD